MKPEPSARPRHGAGAVWRRLPALWRVLAPALRPARWALVWTALLTAALSLSIMPVLWLLRIAFDRAIPKGDWVLLLEVGAGVVAIRVAIAVFSLVLRKQVIRAVKQAILVLRAELLARVYTRTREGLTRSEADRLHHRIVHESERLDVFCNQMLSYVMPAIFTVAGLFVFLSLQSPMMVLVAAIVLPALWAGGRLTQGRVDRATRRFQEAFEQFSKGVSFVIRQIDLTRSQGHEQAELQRQQAHLERLAENGRTMSFNVAINGQTQSLVTGVAGIVLLVVGGWQVMHQQLTLGQLLVFYFGATLLNGALYTISRSASDIIAAGLSVERLQPLLAPETAPRYQGTDVIALAGSFELRGVGMVFDREPVLRGIDLTIGAGERIGIVGANGAGKSTLLQILLGLVRPTEGEMRADGRPYDSLDVSALRRQIGVVPQRAGFFHGSVHDNIAYGAPDADREAVRSAARLAGAAEFVEALPQGYDTPIGDGGQALSGGECQRLALARALLRQPRVLVLDEPTNHLDVGAVAELVRRLSALQTAPTLIVVSHDRRVLQLVERTYELRAGRLQLQPALAVHEGARAVAP